jgi:hypothetical protein
MHIFSRKYFESFLFLLISYVNAEECISKAVGESPVADLKGHTQRPLHPLPLKITKLWVNFTKKK